MGSASAARSGSGGWGHLLDAVHMVAVTLGCERTMVGTGLAASRPGLENRVGV